MGQSNSFLRGYDEEKLMEKIQETIEKRAQREATDAEASKDDPKHLDCKLNFRDSYTELKFTSQKRYLKWKTVHLQEKGKTNMNATIGKYQIRVDKIYGLTLNDNNSFTIYALGPRDDSEKETRPSSLQNLATSGKNLVKNYTKFLSWTPTPWFQNEYIFEASTSEQAVQWLDALAEVTDTNWAECDMMVFYDPEYKNSTQVYESVKKMLYNGNINANVKVTNKMQESVFLMRDLIEYQGLIVIGDDYMVQEAINGLLRRPDWDYLVPKLTLGVIPCGDGSLLCKALGVTNPSLATLNIIRGVKQPMDLLSITNPTGFRMFSHLYLNWGLVSDIKLDSKGIPGWNMSTLWHLLNLKVYQGTLHYLPVDMEHQTESKMESYKESMALSDAERLAKPGPVDHFDKVDMEHLPSKWKSISSAFTALYVMNHPWLTSTIQPSPLAIGSDGAVDLVFTQSGLFGLASWLLSPKTKSMHLKNPAWNFERVKALIFDPGMDMNGKPGRMEVDGTSIPYTTIRMEVHEGLLQIFTPNRKVEAKAEKMKEMAQTWKDLESVKRWAMVEFEEYKKRFVWFWVFAFALLFIVLAYAIQI